MATRGMGHLDERKAQELSNTAWALATAHVEQARDSAGPSHPSILACFMALRFQVWIALLIRIVSSLACWESDPPKDC